MRVVREEAGFSERHACGLIGMHRGSWRYHCRERNEEALRARLRELPAERPRFGYRRLYIFLRREKTEDGTLRWRVNHNRVYRLYREKGLAMQRRRRKRFRAEAWVPLALPTRANEAWTMDYTRDELAGGRKFRTLNPMDGYTREALRIEPNTSLPGLRVVRVLEGLRERRGTPAAIQVDNGTEFTSRVVDQWAYQNQVSLHFIERGKPTQNAFIESFNGKFRDECLNQNWFVYFQHAREVIEAWRVGYNTACPHSSLRDQLGLTGTKIACDRDECGACTVLLDAKPAYSCSNLAVWINGREVQTVEGSLMVSTSIRFSKPSLHTTDRSVGSPTQTRGLLSKRFHSSSRHARMHRPHRSSAVAASFSRW